MTAEQYIAELRGFAAAHKPRELVLFSLQHFMAVNPMLTPQQRNIVGDLTAWAMRTTELESWEAGQAVGETSRGDVEEQLQQLEELAKLAAAA